MPARAVLLSLLVLMAACAPATTGVTAAPPQPIPQAQPAPQPQPVAQSRPEAPGRPFMHTLPLPEGSRPATAPVEVAQATAGACAADIARFRAVIENDRKTGHVAASVHENITRDLGPVEATCQAGRSAEASRALATVRTRYGYR